MEREFQWEFKEILFLFLLLIGIELVGIYIGKEIFTAHPLRVTLFLRGVDLSVLFFFVREKWKWVWGEGRNLRGAGWGVGASLVLFFFLSIIHLLPYPEFKQLLKFPLPKVSLFEIIILLLLPVVVEEIVFRGALYSFLKERWGVSWGIFLSSLIFAIFHFWSGTSLLLPFLGGIVFAFLREKSGSLLAPIIFHSLGNLEFILFTEFLL